MKKSQAKELFPYEQFPVKLIHKDGKDLKDTKTCYFQSKEHAEKYITKCKFKKKDYQIYFKDDSTKKPTSKRRVSVSKPKA